MQLYHFGDRNCSFWCHNRQSSKYLSRRLLETLIQRSSTLPVETTRIVPIRCFLWTIEDFLKPDSLKIPGTVKTLGLKKSDGNIWWHSRVKSEQRRRLRTTKTFGSGRRWRKSFGRTIYENRIMGTLSLRCVTSTRDYEQRPTPSERYVGRRTPWEYRKTWTEEKPSTPRQREVQGCRVGGVVTRHTYVKHAFLLDERDRTVVVKTASTTLVVTSQEQFLPHPHPLRRCFEYFSTVLHK